MPRTRTATVAASPALAAETVIASITGLTLPVGAVVDIEGAVDMTIGTSGTTVTLRVRRGTDTTGSVVGTAFGPFTVTAASRYSLTVNVFDQFPGEEQGQGYVLTAQVANGAAQSTVNALFLGAIW